MRSSVGKRRLCLWSPWFVFTAVCVAASCPVTDAHAQPSPTAAGPSAKSTTLTDLIVLLEQRPNATQLSDDQKKLLNEMRIYRDRVDPHVIYWVPPLNIAAPIGGPAFSERINLLVFQAAENADDFLRKLENDAAGAPVDESRVKKALLNPTDLETPNEDNTPPTLHETSGALGQVFMGTPEESKNRFVEVMRLALTRAGMTVPTGLDFGSALDEAAVLFRRTAALNLQVPVGFGLDPERLKAFRILRQGLPDYKFFELESGPEWTLQQQGVVSDRAKGEKVAENVAMPMLKMHQDIFTNLGQGNPYLIGAGGGTMTVGISYAGAITYGYGKLDNPDELVAEGRLHLHDYLPGFLSQAQTINVTLQGTARCRFKAEIKLDQVFDLEKRNGVAVVTDKSRMLTGTTADVAPEINDCQILDANGQVLNISDPTIANLAAGARSQHVNDKLNLYNATVGLKDTIRRRAQSAADGWKYLPLPTEPKLVHEWQSYQSCQPVRTNRYCAEWTEDSFLGIVYDSYCSRWDYNFAQACDTYYRAMDRYVQVPVSAAYFNDHVTFDKVWDTVTDYPISASEPVSFVVTAFHAVCLQRDPQTNAAGERIFVRTRCSGENQEQARMKTDLDQGTPDPNRNDPNSTGGERFRIR